MSKPLMHHKVSSIIKNSMVTALHDVGLMMIIITCPIYLRNLKKDGSFIFHIRWVSPHKYLISFNNSSIILCSRQFLEQQSLVVDFLIGRLCNMLTIHSNSDKTDQFGNYQMV